MCFSVEAAILMTVVMLSDIDANLNIHEYTREGLTLETSATHQTPQGKNIPYQPLSIKPLFSLLANAEKTVFFQN